MAVRGSEPLIGVSPSFFEDSDLRKVQHPEVTTIERSTARADVKAKVRPSAAREETAAAVNQCALPGPYFQLFPFGGL